MRRSEFFSDDEDEFREIVGRAHVGHLGLIDVKGYPRIVPLNFVAIGRDIYFHGAQEGEKFDLLKESPKASFSVDLPFAFIPSYWQSKRSAEPTSVFFKSLHIRGRGEVVNDLTEKAHALQAMMEKYQPEGGYERIEVSNPIYRKPLERVGVFRIVTEELTMKIKFGQNMDARKIGRIIEGLRERNLPMDLETIKNILKYRKS
ncbi:MAG: pyridoxamine 5'-phosphate oxidase family protein [Methanobacteriota archaeon]|nr:MAG: pyridoxamine 5'-phosphate oxidase family protein [Euryarchaeota archaeon]